jgi:release factor glutamine methyltransferase
MKQNVLPKQDLTKSDPSAKSLLKQLQDQFKAVSGSPYLDALTLLSHISQLSKSKLLSDPSISLTEDQSKRLEDCLEKVKSGQPLPYVLGSWEFFQLIFHITPEVLIPRPETEGLVELVLDWFWSHPEKRICLELGTGSGCIAVALAKSIPDLKVIATDISPAALQVAQINAKKHAVYNQIQFLERDLLQGIPDTVDLLVANLPYIPTGKLKSLSVYKTEPTIALDGGRDGLHYIKNVLKDAARQLNPGGAVFLELDEDCGAAALSLAKEVFPGLTLKLSQDLSGQDRYLYIQT